MLADQSLFLRDETGTIQARLLDPISAAPYIWSVNTDNEFSDLLQNFSAESFERPHSAPVIPGDRVEVIGTPSASGLGLILSDAEYRRLASGPPPAAVEVSSKDFHSRLREGELVTWRGRLIDFETHQTQEAAEVLLVLRDGDTNVRALFTSEKSRVLPALPLSFPVSLENGRRFARFG
ncbi:MAG TPA: hypothetical protein VGO59_04080 [Verrucomicrobiae bacterium]